MKQAKLILTRTALLLFVMFLAQSVAAKEDDPLINWDKYKVTIGTGDDAITLNDKAWQTGLPESQDPGPAGTYSPVWYETYSGKGLHPAVSVQCEKGKGKDAVWVTVDEYVYVDYSNNVYARGSTPAGENEATITINLNPEYDELFEWKDKNTDAEPAEIVKHFVINKASFETYYLIAHSSDDSDMTKYSTRYYNGQGITQDDLRATNKTIPNSSKHKTDRLSHFGTWFETTSADAGTYTLPAPFSPSVYLAYKWNESANNWSSTELYTPLEVLQLQHQGQTVPDSRKAINVTSCFNITARTNDVEIKPLPVCVVLTGDDAQSLSNFYNGKPYTKEKAFKFNAYGLWKADTEPNMDFLKTNLLKLADLKYTGEESDFIASRVDVGTSESTVDPTKFQLPNDNFVWATKSSNAINLRLFESEDAPSKFTTVESAVTVNQAKINVNQRVRILVTTESAGVEEPLYYYNGKALTADKNYIVDYEKIFALDGAPTDLAMGEKLVVEVTGSQTNAGSSDNTATVKVMRENKETGKEEESGGLDDAGNFVSNYAIKVVPGTLTVTPAPVTVTAESMSIELGENPKFSATVEGLVEGESEDLISYAFDCDYDYENPVAGTYDIIVDGEEGQGNYVVTFVDGELTVYGPGVTVLIHGNQETLDYTGANQTVKGYTFTLVPENAVYTEEDFTFTGSARVQRKKIGTTYMTLSADDFINNNEGVEATFVIADQGSITIKYYDAVLDDENGATEIDKIVYEKGGKANVALTRSLFKDGEWNTLCLPFDVDLTADDCPLAGADVRTLSDATLNGDNLSLTFTEEGAITTLAAGVPYLVKWEPIKKSEAPVFEAVTVTDELSDVEIELGDEKAIAFKGAYAPVKFTETDKSVLFVGEGSKLYYPLAGAHVDSERAYFQLTGFTVDDLQGGASAIGMRFDGTTGISNLMNAVEITYYDLSGRRVAQPTKGIYIANGKKVVIK